MGYAALGNPFTHQIGQFVAITGNLAALTEQCRVTGGSIEARVDG